MKTVEDVLTSLSSTGRAEVTEALEGLDIDPDSRVFAGQQDNDAVFPVRGVTEEQITPLKEEVDGEEVLKGFEGITPENDPETAEEMKTEDSFKGMVIVI